MLNHRVEAKFRICVISGNPPLAVTFRARHAIPIPGFRNAAGMFMSDVRRDRCIHAYHILDITPATARSQVGRSRLCELYIESIDPVTEAVMVSNGASIAILHVSHGGIANND